jgi:hypothetical protein
MAQRDILRASLTAAFSALLVALGCNGQPRSAGDSGLSASGAESAGHAGLAGQSGAESAGHAGLASESGTGNGGDAGMAGEGCTGARCARSCDATTCPIGCCDSNGVCQSGASSDACGMSGRACEACTASGAQCFGQRCAEGLEAGVCNAETCPTGCCQSGLCRPGVTGVACGGSGMDCQNCLSIDLICSNQQCAPDPGAAPACNPTNCNCGCCDDRGKCLAGLDAGQCGTGGRRCVDCSTNGNECLDGVCTLPDGGKPCSQTCAGCCDAAGACQPGFTDSQCGQIGGTCLDCTSLSPASTCDVNVSPRTCVSLQSQCPGNYPSCPASLQEPAPLSQKVCSSVEIQNAAAGCAGGPDTVGCNAFFNLEAAANAACSGCLQQFNYKFADGIAIRLCIEPFVDAACNHNSACLLECVEEACYSCLDTPSAVLCATQVQSGACAPYYHDDGCVTDALNGAGAVCNPATYAGSYRAWFQAVAGLYCANGVGR